MGGRRFDCADSSLAVVSCPVLSKGLGGRKASQRILGLPGQLRGGRTDLQQEAGGHPTRSTFRFSSRIGILKGLQVQPRQEHKYQHYLCVRIWSFYRLDNKYECTK
jgi:hypothetical protein